MMKWGPYMALHLGIASTWMKCIIPFFLVLTTIPALTQQKFERERRVHDDEVPEKSREFIDSIQLSSKIRWYEETGINKTSYEAKTKFKGQRLSIEFSEEGEFEDLEIEIEPESIPSTAYAFILDHFESEHGDYDIRKIQIQYLGKPKEVISYFLRKANRSVVSINYEIVISAKEEGSFVLYEYLFDEHGAFIQRSRIILNMSDNIEY